MTAIWTENLAIFLTSMYCSLLIRIRMLTLRVVMKLRNYVCRMPNSPPAAERTLKWMGISLPPDWRAHSYSYHLVFFFFSYQLVVTGVTFKCTNWRELLMPCIYWFFFLFFFKAVGHLIAAVLKENGFSEKIHQSTNQVCIQLCAWVLFSYCSQLHIGAPHVSGHRRNDFKLVLFVCFLVYHVLLPNSFFFF